MDCPRAEVTFRQFVLEVTIEGANNKIFNNIETSSGYGKLYLLTTKQNLDVARKWVDSTIATMEELPLEESELKEMTGYSRVFRRVDQVSVSDAEQAYSANMLRAQTIGGVTSTKMNVGPTNAPTKKAWNRIFYGPDMSSQGTSETKT